MAEAASVSVMIYGAPTTMSTAITSRALRDITHELDLIGEELEAAGGELPPGSEIERRWNDACGALVAKVDSFALYTQMLDGQVATLKDAAKRLQAKAKAVEAHRERLLRYAGLCIGTDRKELAGDAWRIVRAKNPPSVEVLDEDAVYETCPQAFQAKPLEGRYTLSLDGSKVLMLTIDKALLRDALKGSQAEHIRGARLVQGERIAIK